MKLHDRFDDDRGDYGRAGRSLILSFRGCYDVHGGQMNDMRGAHVRSWVGLDEVQVPFCDSFHQILKLAHRNGGGIFLETLIFPCYIRDVTL